MTISRRTALGFAPALLRGKAKAGALAVVGDRYHNIDYIRTAFERTLVQEAGLPIDFTDDVRALSADSLKRYPMLIMLRDGMMWPRGYISGTVKDIVSKPSVALNEEPVGWITPEQGAAIKAYAKGGGSILFFHNVTYIAPYNKDFREVLGAATLDHPPTRPFAVKVVNRDHPITKGVNDFFVTDEQHYMQYDGDQKHVLLRSINEDGLAFKDLGTSCEAGWAYDYGKGRVVYLAPGHLIPTLWNPEYVKLQKNAVAWLQRRS